MCVVKFYFLISLVILERVDMHRMDMMIAYLYESILKGFKMLKVS